MAVSAWPSSPSRSVPCSGVSATPTLASTDTSSPSIRKGPAARRSSRQPSASTRSVRSPWPGSASVSVTRRVNSSPPRRVTITPSGAPAIRAAAMRAISSSPAWWPSASLTPRKRSTSSSSRAQPGPPPAAVTNSGAATAARWLWLPRPVSGSRRARSSAARAALALHDPGEVVAHAGDREQPVVVEQDARRQPVGTGAGLLDQRHRADRPRTDPDVDGQLDVVVGGVVVGDVVVGDVVSASSWSRAGSRAGSRARSRRTTCAPVTSPSVTGA